jgi:hypothetical protein
MNKFRQWLFQWRLKRLFKKLAKAEESLRHIEIAKRYFLPEPLAVMPKPKKTKAPKTRGDIPVRITYD